MKVLMLLVLGLLVANQTWAADPFQYSKDGPVWADKAVIEAKIINLFTNSRTDGIVDSVTDNARKTCKTVTYSVSFLEKKDKGCVRYDVLATCADDQTSPFYHPVVTYCGDN